MESDGERSDKMVPDSNGSSKISFLLPLKSSGKPKARPWEDKESHVDEDRPELLNEFDLAKPIKKLKVIPMLENSWHSEKKMNNIQMKDTELQFEPEGDVKNSHDTNGENGLNLRTHAAGPMDIDQNGEEAPTLEEIRSGMSVEEFRFGKGAAVGDSEEEEDCLRRLMKMRVDGMGNSRDVRVQEDYKNVIQETVLPVSWLTTQIRVRVISRDIQGGKLYMKKGIVIDVVDSTTCDLLMDGNGAVVVGVKQDAVEAALPKRGGPVMVVEGKQRGVVGKLLERDSDKGLGLVWKEDTYETLTLSLDHIAEFVAWEPEELGYW